ncbi:MAG: type II toxin-antitoxin system HicB family antitoxin [Nitrosospira sp.]
MRYPIAIETSNERNACGVVVPDLPGCFSAGNTMDEAIANAHKSILMTLENYLDEGQAFPAPGTVDEHRENPEFHGRTWALVNVDLCQIDDAMERITITLPKRLLRLIDEGAKLAGESRSSFFARAGLDVARIEQKKPPGAGYG